MTDFRLNRILSRPLTHLLLRTPLTPNQITFLTLAFGVLAGVFFSSGLYLQTLLGAFFYQTAVVLDNCDGEVARAKNMKSEFGSWLDIAADFFTDVALFTGIGLGVYRQGVEGPVLLFTLLCVSGSGLHVFLVVMEKVRGFGPAVYQAPHPEHAQRKDFWLTLFDALREGDISWGVVLLTVFNGLPWLLWLGGIYMQALWIGALLVNFRWTFLKRPSA